jgi:hypothetical protein
MERRRLARFGLMLGLAGLFGCAPLPTPQVSVAPAPVAVAAPPPVLPVPVALLPPPPPVMVMPPPPPPVGAAMPGHQAVSVAHRVIHHRWLRRYAAVRTDYYGPPCGSDVHPCHVFHTVVPVQ